MTIFVFLSKNDARSNVQKVPMKRVADKTTGYVRSANISFKKLTHVNSRSQIRQRDESQIFFLYNCLKNNWYFRQN